MRPDNLIAFLYIRYNIFSVISSLVISYLKYNGGVATNAILKL